LWRAIAGSAAASAKLAGDNRGDNDGRRVGGGVAGAHLDAGRRLQALARTDYGGNTGALPVVYGVEGFPRRLAPSPGAANMTLKGGMLMAATSVHHTRRLGGEARAAEHHPHRRRHGRLPYVVFATDLEDADVERLVTTLTRLWVNALAIPERF